MNARRAVLALVLSVAAVAMSSAPAAAQCAMCKTTLTGSAEGRAVSGDLNRAILMMLAAPYVVFGTLAAVIFRKPLRARLARLRSRGRAAA